MPAPEKIYLVHPDIAGSPFLPIPAAAVLIAFNGWQLANPDDAQWLTPTPPDPVPEVVTRDELDEAIGDLSGTFVPQASLAPAVGAALATSRKSLMLTSFLTAGASQAANRTAWQAAIDAAQTAGMDLCYDGAFFAMSGEPVTSTATGFTHWASSNATHKVTQKTRGLGGLRVTGQYTTVSGLNIDGDNPNIDMTGARGGAATSRHSFGICIEPTAHYSVIRDFKVDGFMYGVSAGSMTPEQLVSANVAADVTPANYPPLLNITVDGISAQNVFSAFVSTAITGLGIRRVTGTYKRASGGAGGADPHLIYLSGWALSEDDMRLWNYNVSIDDCLALAPPVAVGIGNAFKARAVKGLSITNLRSRGCPGVLDLINIEDLSIGAGVAAFADISTNQAVSLLLVTRGEVQPFLVEKATGATGGGLRLAQSSGVRVLRPSITMRPTGTLVTDVITIHGPNPSCRIVQPEIVNAGTGSLKSGVTFLEESGMSGSTSGATVEDPVMRGGTFGNGVRHALTGAKTIYDPTSVAATTKIVIDAAVATAMVINRAARIRYDLDPRTIGWHMGEPVSSLPPVGRWPSGQPVSFFVGNNWTGDSAGRVTVGNNGGAQILTAAFGTADVEIRANVLLGASTRAGFALRANNTTDSLIVSRIPGGVRIAKKTGSTPTTLASGTTTLPDAVMAELRAVVIGARVLAYLDGALLADCTLTGGDETTFGTSTSHGLAAELAAAAAWERVVVSRLS